MPDTAFMVFMPRDWEQAAEDQPAIEFALVEYDEEDELGFIGEVRLHIQMAPGRLLLKTLKMKRNAFRFVVDTIAGRYHAGGP